MIGDESDAAYYRRRAGDEAAAAAATSDILASGIHRTLANLYEAQAATATVTVTVKPPIELWS